uniref:Uncharacterized protein n=1 Tax=viral metagenome TaxID=1070528 RepID=A0A6C0KTL9_9ZZZZ
MSKNCKPEAYSQFFSDSAIIVGTLIISITMTISNTNGGLIGHMIGYGFLAAGFVIKSGLLASILAKGDCVSKDQALMFFLMSVCPFIIIVFLILAILYILNSYFNRIVGGKVSKGYKTFSRMFIVILIAQLGLFYNATQEEKYKTENVISPIYGMLIYLLSVINILVLITIYVVLAFYSTDG